MENDLRFIFTRTFHLKLKQAKKKITFIKINSSRKSQKGFLFVFNFQGKHRAVERA
jgi:hypothetical protein